jgi:hypothetical protein
MRKQMLAVIIPLLMLLAVSAAQNAGPSPAMAASPPAVQLYDQRTVAAGKYNGPGGCAASSCHGSVQPKTTTRIFQNEYTIWIAPIQSPQMPGLPLALRACRPASTDLRTCRWREL